MNFQSAPKLALSLSKGFNLSRLLKHAIIILFLILTYFILHNSIFASTASAHSPTSGSAGASESSMFVQSVTCTPAGLPVVVFKWKLLSGDTHFIQRMWLDVSTDPDFTNGPGESGQNWWGKPVLENHDPFDELGNPQLAFGPDSTGTYTYFWYGDHVGEQRNMYWRLQSHRVTDSDTAGSRDEGRAYGHSAGPRSYTVEACFAAPSDLRIAQNDCVQTNSILGNVPRVRFSWTQGGTSTLRLQIARGPNFFTDFHQTGNIAGTSSFTWSFLNKIGTAKPEPNTTYFWRLWDGNFHVVGPSFTTRSCPNPSPSPSPTPPPIPSACQTQPGDPPNSCPCQNPKNTDYLTDNYIADDSGNPLDSEFTFTLTTTGANGQVRTLTKDLTFSFDLSELQSLFADQNADYLEGKFQDGGHRTTNLLSLESSDFNKFHGPAQKVAPKAMVDALKAKYVKYVWDNPSLPEASFKYNDTAAQGGNKSVHDLVTAYGMPSPPDAGDSRDAWNNTWGKYWEKVPTSYNEFFKGYLVFKYAHSEKLIEAAKGKGDFEYCPRSLDRQITLVFPDFFRTAATAGQLNQVVVPKAAQSVESNDPNNLLLATAENTKNILASVVKKCAQAIAGNPISKKIRKAVKVSLDTLTPVKTANAQEPEASPAPCVKVKRPSIGGISNYCALPAGQLQTGESCTNVFDTNRLDPDNLNVTCTVNIHWQHTFTIGTVTNIDVNNPENTTLGFDNCQGDPIVECQVTVTVWPVFRIPFLREIWNNTTFSDEKELDDVGPVLGATLGEQNLSTITGRPGLHTIFKPEGATRDKELEKKLAEQEQVQDQIIDEFITCGSSPGGSEATCLPILLKFPLGANLKLAGSTNRSAGDIKERLIGATDCSKEFVRDVALKPKALQQHLGVVPLCNMVNQILAQANQPPSGSGPPPPGGSTPPNNNTCGGIYTLNNPIGNFGDPNCNFSRSRLFQRLNALDPANANFWFFTVVPCESGYNPNAYNAASTAGQALGLFQMGHAAYPQLGLDYQIADPGTEYDRGDVEWRTQASNAVNYNNQIIGGSFAYWACAQ